MVLISSSIIIYILLRHNIGDHDQSQISSEAKGVIAYHHQEEEKGGAEDSFQRFHRQLSETIIDVKKEDTPTVFAIADVL